MIIEDICKLTKESSYELASYSTKVKDKLLKGFSKALIENIDKIILENNKDVLKAKKDGISNVMIDRLLLNKERIIAMSNSVDSIAKEIDPIGEEIKGWKNKSGLLIRQIRVPFGVIGIVYESRPNVTADAISLAIKTSNAIILKGGKEAINSNRVIVEIFKKEIEKYCLNKNIVNLIETKNREELKELLIQRKYVDIIIPRGSSSLINHVIENSNIPVIETGIGNCHLFIDYNADSEMAKNILINGKASRPSVCNSLENLLVHKNHIKTLLPILIEELKNNNIEIRGCEICKSIDNSIILSTDLDYKTEFLDYIIAIKVVDSIEKAIDHITKYGTHHSEAIVTNDYNNANLFTEKVDAAAVYVNASTRFTDGEEFGFGAEMGISTQKLHVTGPMGIKALTSTKYIINGNGQCR